MLLIPAMLVSGTAVDLVRIHTARSIIQDANQLAANALLTQYNALLYDIYGLLGVAEDDPILWELLDEYIRVSVFGEEMQDKTLGTLQVFYGAGLTLEEPYFPEEKNLRNEEVLRRQIEEYMKFRGPVLLVKEFIEKLTENKIKEDAETIEKKLEVDSSIADLCDKYKELYDAIVAADRCNQAIGGIAGGSFGNMSSILTKIHEEFGQLSRLYRLWELAEDGMSMAAFAARYRAVLVNIRSLTIGGLRGVEWSLEGWVRYENYNVGLNQAVENAKKQADDFKPKFDEVVRIAREVDRMKVELSRKVDELESRINSGECSQELASAFTERNGSPPKSIIERYRDILKWNIEPMAVAFRNGGYNYIDNIHKPMVDGVRYRNADDPYAASLSRAELANLPSDSRFSLSYSIRAASSRAAYFANFPAGSVTYKMAPGFLKFSEHSGDHNAFFTELSIMVNQQARPPIALYDGQQEAAGSNVEAKQRNMINDVLRLVNTAYEGLSNNPLGAKYISDDRTPVTPRMNMLEIVAMIPQALAAPVINIIQDPLGSVAGAGDYILLLTYSTSMLSNYASARPESIGKTRDDLDGINFPKNMSGVPMSPDVNYFFQSEWEYLYNGSENAGTNLSAVTKLVFMLRLVCNYIRAFSVQEINGIVNSIRTAFSWAPPLGIVLGELARAAFVAAESVVDVAALRSGHKVPMFKNIAAGEWVCVPSRLAGVVRTVALNGTVDGDLFKSERGLTYSNYMLYFFITKAVFYIGTDGDAANELAKRTGNLIEWNVINFQSKSKADEGKMAEALTGHGRFRLSNMKTDFSITTTIDLRMLFLSMAFAQNFSDSRGIGIPQTMPVSVTDHRGY